uniref:Nitroreductase domain-containing protein n=1 Tax=Macrostomum lignano TaxID=282301 RepID=A0A1I8H880_9PLAT
MTDAFTLWSLFKDSTTLQAVLGSLIGFLVMHLFQQRRTAVPNMPMDERLMPGYRGGLSAATMPSDLPFSMGSKSQKTKNSKQPEKQKQKTEMLKRATDFANLLSRRRSCRQFSERPVDPEVVRLLVTAAGSSPSGAHTEPWTYVCVTNELMKRRIREIVEEEEEINYARRMSAEWKADLAKLRTSWEKPYLTEAPVIVVLMRQRSGGEAQHYYSEISVSISAGLFLAAVQNVGLCTLTSTPMNAGPALRRLLGRPPNEKVHLLLPLGYAAHNAQVPNLTRKPVEKIMVNI